jgi:hypothetical protein
MQIINGFQSLIPVGKQAEVIQLPRISSFASDFDFGKTKILSKDTFDGKAMGSDAQIILSKNCFCFLPESVF